MPRDYADDEWDDEDDWDDRYDDQDDDGPLDESRAMIVQTDESQALAALDNDDGPLNERRAVTIIPGEGLPERVSHRRRRRPLTMQLIIASVLICVLGSGLFLFAPLSPSGGNGPINTFSSLASAVTLTKQNFFLYRAQSGDRFDLIAQKFHVSEGGIYELNGLNANDEAVVGVIYKVPTDPSFGVNFHPPLPVGIYQAGGGLTATNYYGIAGCMFCSHGGQLNDNGQSATCATGYLIGGQTGDTTKFQLVIPDPSSHWVRGFYEFHDGIDMSTGHDGTPIVAAQAGQVIYAGWDDYGSGYAVKINHCGGLATSYSHMLANIAVKSGQYVTAGQIIGYQGNTGNSFGSHLHFMVWWDNIPFDALCAYGSIDGVSNTFSGYSSDWHYGGCPPNLIKHTAWNP